MLQYALNMCQDLYLPITYSLIVICPNKDILYVSLTERLFDTNTQKEDTKMFKASSQKEISTKLMKGLLDMIILQFLNNEPMHGYQVIIKIRKNFGVYFGPSTIYPLLGTLEQKGFVESKWNMKCERPRKIYSLTSEGQSMLNYTEESLNLICRKITIVNPEIEPEMGLITSKTKGIS